MIIWIYFLWQFVTGFRKGYNTKVTAGFFFGFWVLPAWESCAPRPQGSGLIACAFLIPVLLFPFWYTSN